MEYKDENMTITIIAAMTKSRVIGKNNQLPWHIAEDLQNFKKLTAGNTVIMGRKTYESIGRPLPNRNNIVISTMMPARDGVTICKTVPEAIEKAKTFQKDIFIVGGATIYEQTLPFADRLVISYIKKDYEGDTYFPNFNEDDWNIKKREDRNEFELILYKRKQKQVSNEL